MDVIRKVATGTQHDSQKIFGKSHERLQELLEMERKNEVPVRMEERGFQKEACRWERWLL